ncbi:chemotaxis protein [Sesbania bispinosa]|nr:chemotaxis protein [Sesbania bispinosa]
MEARRRRLMTGRSRSGGDGAAQEVTTTVALDDGSCIGENEGAQEATMMEARSWARGDYAAQEATTLLGSGRRRG